MDERAVGLPPDGGLEPIPRFALDYGSFRDLHRLVSDKPVSNGCESRFACRLMLYFPEVAVHIDEDDFGILHLEMGELKLATREAIIRGEWYTVRKHFNFVADLYENAGSELRDAIGVSYLGNLLYGEPSPNYAHAREMLPASLSFVLQSLEQHYESGVAR